MATFEYPVPYTATLAFNNKTRKYNVLGSLTVDLEELSKDELTLVASWKAASYRERGAHNSLGDSGECFWNNGRFLSPILVQSDAEDGPEFRPLRPTEVRQMLLSRDQVFTYDEAFFYSSKPYGYQHDLYKETLSNDGWRPETLPNGKPVEDTFTSQAYSARHFLTSLALVDGNLFQITSEPVIGCTYNSESDSVAFHIRTTGKFHEDWEVFRLDRLEDALAYAEERWPNKASNMLFDPLVVHDGSHLSFTDEGYALTFSARALVDEAMTKLANLKKDVGLNVLKLNRILPTFDNERPAIPDDKTLDEIVDRLPSIEPALNASDCGRLSTTINRWHLRPSTSNFSFK